MIFLVILLWLMSCIVLFTNLQNRGMFGIMLGYRLRKYGSIYSMYVYS